MNQQKTNTGTLVDSEIKDLVEKGLLITSDFDPSRLKQACYELRASQIYFDLSSDQPDTKNDAATEYGGYILLKPRHSVAVIVKEVIDLPDDMLGRVLSKGSLFSLGIVPVNTYADPGFSGRLGIILTNTSNNYIRIIDGEPIAKIEFSRLPKPVAKSYNGQHGYETKIWPYRKELFLSAGEISKDPRIGTQWQEFGSIHGAYVEKVLDRVFMYERRYLIVSLVAFGVGIWLTKFGTENPSAALVGAVVGIVVNLLTQLVNYLILNVRRK